MRKTGREGGRNWGKRFNVSTSPWPIHGKVDACRYRHRIRNSPESDLEDAKKYNLEVQLSISFESCIHSQEAQELFLPLSRMEPDLNGFPCPTE